MKSSWKKVAVFAFALAIVVGLGLSRSQASSSVAEGKFKLPFQANLGGMSLAAGVYTYSVEQMSNSGKITIYQNNRAVGMLHAQSFTNFEDKSQYPVLVFVRHENNVMLRAFKFPRTGTFYFSLPKEMNTLIAQEPQLIETIQVQASGD
jgi:hypothetical protein